jgi:hypothetical protein
MIRLARGQFGTYLLQNLADDGSVAGDLLVQTDYDYPGIAGDFGWSLRSVMPYLCESCDAPTATVIAEGGDIPDVPICTDCMAVAPDPAYLATVVRTCEHDGTDGTIACACGLTAVDFIGAACEYLDSHIGATADDPGYFA